MPETPPKKIQLQSVGWVPAAEAQELEVGDTLMWNGGDTSEVVAITEASTHFLAVDVRSNHDGKTYTRRWKRTSLVARVARPKAAT